MANGYRLRELKVEVTRECPLECLHCSSNGALLASERLDPHKVVGLIEEFAEMGGETLAISGGEPLVYKDLPLILKVCRTLDIQPDFYTSGVCTNGRPLSPISEDTLELLSQSGARVIFSLHGAHATTHDALTQVVGSFDTTLVSVERTIEAEIPTEVHIVPTAMNFREIGGIARLVASVGVKRVSWLRFVPQGRGQLNRDILQLTKEQLMQLGETKVRLQQKYQEVKIRTGAPFNILCPDCPSPCTAGMSVLVIRPDGRALPCDAFKRFEMQDEFGNVLNHSLSEVWRKSYLLNALRQIQELKSDSSCASCPQYECCRSGCLAQKAIAVGRLTDGKDPDCLLNSGEVESGRVEAISVC